MLLQPSVSRFSKTKLQLNHSKNMFNFGAYRGFLMLTAFDLCLGACGVLLTLAGTAIDFVVDRLTGLVLLQRSWSFLRSEIAAVPIDLFLISGKKFRGHRNIMLVGSCHFYRMNQTTFFIYSDMGFIAKVPYIAFFCRVSLRVTSLLLILGRGMSLDKKVPDPFAPMNTFTRPGSNETFSKVLKFLKTSLLMFIMLTSFSKSARYYPSHSFN